MAEAFFFPGEAEHCKWQLVDCLSDVACAPKAGDVLPACFQSTPRNLLILCFPPPSFLEISPPQPPQITLLGGSAVWPKVQFHQQLNQV